VRQELGREERHGAPDMPVEQQPFGREEGTSCDVDECRAVMDTATPKQRVRGLDVVLRYRKWIRESACVDALRCRARAFHEENPHVDPHVVERLVRHADTEGLEEA